MPSQRRDEVQKAKQQMMAYQELKQQKQFIKRRAKLIKAGWRNGICGVEMPDDNEDSVIYQSNTAKILSC